MPRQLHWVLQPLSNAMQSNAVLNKAAAKAKSAPKRAGPPLQDQMHQLIGSAGIHRPAPKAPPAAPSVASNDGEAWAVFPPEPDGDAAESAMQFAFRPWDIMRDSSLQGVITNSTEFAVGAGRRMRRTEPTWDAECAGALLWRPQSILVTVMNQLQPRQRQSRRHHVCETLIQLGS